MSGNLPYRCCPPYPPTVDPSGLHVRLAVASANVLPERYAVMFEFNLFRRSFQPAAGPRLPANEFAQRP